MMLGIIKSVQQVSATASTSTLTPTPITLTPQHYEESIKIDVPKIGNSEWIFINNAPQVFRNMRQEFGITEQSYMESLGISQAVTSFFAGSMSSLSEKISTGRSGSHFFTSQDNKFLIKTILPEESRLLKSILSNYHDHIKHNKDTLLTRYFGWYRMEQKHGESFDFVVMGNLFFSPKSIQEQFDLKGSTYKRTVGNVSNPDIAKKDNDFKTSIFLGEERQKKVLKQLQIDCSFLKELNICDYSLLIGIHNVDKNTEAEEDIKTQISRQTQVYKGSIFQKDYGGMKGRGPEGTQRIYFIGLIDILTVYDFKKMSESLFKSLFNDKNAISAIPPKEYCKRFYDFVKEKIV